jgi:phthalate 4,5-dioxygenase oxygenase subunit
MTMMTTADNDLLCRVEGTAPMGQMMRRHWIPACLSEEVAEPDGDPVRIRLLGEDLVAFRDTDGRLGVLDEHCPHRRASLALGRNEECGLRCLYHGWKIDVEGNVVEMVSEPRESTLAQKIRHKTYPCREAGGFVWVYMGPPETMPAAEPPAWAPVNDTRISIVKIRIPCNWAQVLEGAIDSAHSSSLHSTDMPPARVDGAKATATHWPRPSTDKSPRLQVQPTDFGFRYAAIRRPIRDAATHDYVRITMFVAPFTVLIPPNDQYNLSILNIPRDDTSTTFYFIAWSDNGRGIDQEAWRKFCGARVGVELDADYQSVRTAANRFLQDRTGMRAGDFTGIRGIPQQDMAMWVTMGPIADRSAERLGASDLAVVEFRRMMLDAVRRFAEGGPAIGTVERATRYASLRTFEGIVPKSTNWAILGTEAAAVPASPPSPASPERIT